MKIGFSSVLLILCFQRVILAKYVQKPDDGDKFMRIVLLEDSDSEEDENVDIRDYPWMVSVLERNAYSGRWNHICGGSLLTTNFVLTAHHCLPENKNPDVMSIRSGSSSRTGGIIHSVKEIIPHPQGYDVRYDLGILKIQPKIQFLGGISLPIQIFIGKVESGTRGTVLGWGYANLIPPRQVNFLRKAEVTLMGRDYCEKFTGRGDFLLCSFETDAGVCSGDSGGPLVINEQLAGVISIGGCESLSHANSFVNVSYHREWIESVIEPKFS
ncbi:trypsin 3A1-like [Leptopilina heterotoma]|uniref:trypsin 3A1-like n=1 Tax=Leptopilina heterotoma TaxID=63436 RepID=UPI001CA9182D|nr:trypsin 3A1-like [Leptopilina heterotoma]